MTAFWLARIRQNDRCPSQSGSRSGDLQLHDIIAPFDGEVLSVESMLGDLVDATNSLSILRIWIICMLKRR